ncbi:MAG TPA: HAMP domain-containing sensor histidine kinase [Gaiellaceae bacterium]|nr:HAMP domain-containing sensor histidine kinase [Gaiellaceae bacterium]
MIALAAVALAVAAAVCSATVVLFPRLPTLRLQLATLALVSGAVPLAAVTIGGVAMFEMHADLTILVVLAGAGFSCVAAALLLARFVARRVDALAEAANRMAAGDLEARSHVSGPRELAAVSASFNRMAASVGELFDARRELVAWASHDLRTPLAAIRAMHEAISDGLAGADDYLPALHEQTAILARLTDDLFELARIDARALTLELQETSVLELIRSCMRALEAEAALRHVRLVSRVDPRLPAVRCAPEQLKRVLMNLLTNALRHTPSDGSVALVADAADGELRVAVEDTGVGLSHEASERMFEPFWRGDPARARATGNAGLGLSIARGLVEAHGGRVWAENRRGGGARVAFALPLPA